MTLHRKYQPPGQDKVLHLRTGEESYFEVHQEGQLLEDQDLGAPRKDMDRRAIRHCPPICSLNCR